jgi:hypothetical protein
MGADCDASRKTAGRGVYGRCREAVRHDTQQTESGIVLNFRITTKLPSTGIGIGSGVESQICLIGAKLSKAKPGYARPGTMEIF